MPLWRSLLAIYRRLEARGEIRGGRFVHGFVGEQFALPEALELLRTRRRESAQPANREPSIVSAADPLNLVGIISPGARLSPYSNQAIAYQNGMVIDIGSLGELISRLQHLTRPQQG